jgi:dihydroorotase
MELLVLNATICFPNSPFFNKVCDVLVVNGQIKEITLSSKKTHQASSKLKNVFDAQKAWLMPSLVCLRTHNSDPGNEHKETIETLAKTAVAGGFSKICLLPNSQPPVSSKSAINYLINYSKKLPIDVLPYGTLSQNMEGKEMSEMYDMFQAGAIGFTDGNQPIVNSNLMLRALQYTQIFGAKVFSHAEDTYLSHGGKMHEGNTSVHLGLKGIPALSEEMAIKRDIELIKYCNTAIHFSHISGKNAVEIIQKAKKQGLQITCDVAIANLCYTENDMLDYNSNFKLNPPLRSKEDRKALWNGLMDGTIDAIVSDHFPQNLESKQVEFEYAEEGMITLQTLLPMLIANAPKSFEITHLVEKLSTNPRKIVNQPEVIFEKGQEADFILYDTNKNWIFNDNCNQSKSKNSVLFGKEMKGKVIGFVNKKNVTLN